MQMGIVFVGFTMRASTVKKFTSTISSRSSEEAVETVPLKGLEAAGEGKPPCQNTLRISFGTQLPTDKTGIC